MIRFTLKRTLFDLDVNGFTLAKRIGIHTSTVMTYVNGTVKKIDVEKLDRILDELNTIAIEKKLDRRFTIEDVIKYEKDKPL